MILKNTLKFRRVPLALWFYKVHYIKTYSQINLSAKNKLRKDLILQRTINNKADSRIHKIIKGFIFQKISKSLKINIGI